MGKVGSDGSVLRRLSAQLVLASTLVVAAGLLATAFASAQVPEQATIIVQKQTIPDNYPAPQGGFAFSGAIQAVLADGESASAQVQPGTHTVSEDLSTRPFWGLISIECDNEESSGDLGTLTATYVVEAGETVTCVFTNQKKALLVIEKRTNPQGAGGNQSFPFDASFGDFALTEGQEGHFPLFPGTYSVSEQVPDGWEIESATCDNNSPTSAIELLLETTVRCTFVNRPVAPESGQIRLVKNTVGGDGTFAFSHQIAGLAASLTTSNGTASDTSNALAPGSGYAISEGTLPAGWEFTSAGCMLGGQSTGTVSGQSITGITVQAGNVTTCTFTNTLPSPPETGTIIVEKVTDPAGDPTQFPFLFGETPFTLGDGDSETFDDLQPGGYSVSENTPSGWALTSAACASDTVQGPIDPDQITLSAGETVTCTFVNTRETPPDTGTIIVEKVTNPAGDEQEFDFLFGEEGFTLSDGGSRTFGGLEAGGYIVSEDTPAGWDLTSATCDNGDDPSEIEIEAGDVVTCTFVNTKRGSIVVEKQTSPNGAQGSFTFTGDAAGTIGDGGQIVVPNLVPGEYSSTESAAAGWSLTSIECSNEGSSGDLASRTATFDLGPGETVTCVFTNVQQTVGVGSIDVQKSASPTSLKEPGGPVTFSVRITNTSNVPITVESVYDDKFGDLDDNGGNGCFDVPINLGPGASASCQFQAPVTGPGGTEHVNVVCAEGTDGAGNRLKDCDDARVTITPRLIDLVIVKEATSPTPLNGTVNYSLTVSNKGPDTATNVVMADPAPAGVRYLSATPSQGTCAVAPALVTCQLGTLVAGQTVTIAITGRATAVGTHVNTATVTGDGGRETNPADNTDSAQTVVPAPVTPPVKPNPPPVVNADACLRLTVTPKMITANGKKDRVVATVRAATRPMKGVKVVIRGGGISKSGRTNARGVAVIVVNPTKPGVITITTTSKRDSCGARRIGVVGVFLPPLTG